MCSGIRFTDKAGNMFFGRNLDWSFSYGERVVITPANYQLPSPFGAMPQTRFPLIGMGITAQGIPLYFDCANDQGLAVAGLNFPGFAAYEPQAVESEIYKMWQEGGYFHAERDEHKKPFTIVMPPPNVTGQLHMGHAMDATLQDSIIRFKRMKGYNALWIPGVDHAGIATQIKVEEELRKEGLTRYDLGREKFLERVWDWKNRFGNRIVEQQKKLGASCDWDRARFTMD